MALFFCRLEKKVGKPKRFCLARNVFLMPRVLVKKPFLPERLFDLFLLTLCISFFHSPTMC